VKSSVLGTPEPLIKSGAVPELVTVIDCAGLVVPVSRDANVNDVGESVTAGAAANELVAKDRAVALAAPTLAVLTRTAPSETANIASLAAMIRRRRGLAPRSRESDEPATPCTPGFGLVVRFIFVPPLT
jgi:hypothetical protein